MDPDRECLIWTRKIIWYLISWITSVMEGQESSWAVLKLWITFVRWKILGQVLGRLIPWEKERVIKLLKRRHRFVPVMTGGFPYMKWATASSTKETGDITLLRIRKKLFIFFCFLFVFPSLAFCDLLKASCQRKSVAKKSIDEGKVFKQVKSAVWPPVIIDFVLTFFCRTYFRKKSILAYTGSVSDKGT